MLFISGRLRYHNCTSVMIHTTVLDHQPLVKAQDIAELMYPLNTVATPGLSGHQAKTIEKGGGASSNNV
jgi:hypothetical protein